MSNIEQSSMQGGTGWLSPHRHAYLGELDKLGYATHTINRYRAAVNAFIAQVDLRRVGAGEIDTIVLAELRDAVPELRCSDEQRRRQWCIARFTSWLASSGVIDPPMPPPPAAPGSLEYLTAAYCDWMRQQQGLGEGTIELRKAAFRRFMTFRFGAAPGDLDDITVDDIRGFLDRPSMRKWHGPGVVTRASNLRNFLRFLYATGRTRLNLALFVPRVAKRASRLSRHLSPGEVRQLVDAVHDDNAFGRRNRAMLLLMARLGLRPKEVVAIRLDDINWAAGEIIIRGKGGYHDRMPLPAEVGETIVAYICGGRAGNARHLFVSIRAPHRPLTSATIKKTFRQAFAKTGLEPPNGEIRCHLMRHSLAVALLGQGASLGEVSEVLRHRSLQTTTTYARYDFEALRSVARSWPVPGGIR
ncbi:MAG: tyrosine-type recombinase/integrase [Rhodospirillaceae bacterium]|nr:tyrosine-type recombinase/integrase [Rhodospirillaceae bacterium]